MAESFFRDQARGPTQSELSKALGQSNVLLVELERGLAARIGELTHEWKFYGRKAGWILALGHEGRRILHLIPRSGLFTVVFTLGSRAEVACQESSLPRQILSALREARGYSEGKSIRFDMANPEDLNTALQLAAIKMAH